MYIVIDTWVWEEAQKFQPDSLAFLADLYADCSHTVVCDDSNEIQSEYDKHFREPFPKKLFGNMVKKGKIVNRPRIRIDNNFGFDRADMKFLEVAVTMGATIVSGDSDFLRLKAQMLEDSVLGQRLHQISIMTPGEARETLKLSPWQKNKNS